MEVRHVRLTNQSPNRRRIEITSYLEWVLGSADADANHPAFSKLFVETEYCSERSAIIARRRPRSVEDAEFFGLHTFRSDFQTPGSVVEFETNRRDLSGEVEHCAAPASLESGRRLSQDSGPVLDPIASLRTVIELEPSDVKGISFFVGASPSRDGIDQMLDRLHEAEGIQATESRVALSNGSAKRRISARPTFGDGATIHEDYRPASVKENGHSPTAEASTLFDNGYGGFDAVTASMSSESTATNRITTHSRPCRGSM